MGVIGRYHSLEVDTEKSGGKLRRPPHNWHGKRARIFGGTAIEVYRLALESHKPTRKATSSKSSNQYEMYLSPTRKAALAFVGLFLEFRRERNIGLSEENCCPRISEIK